MVGSCGRQTQHLKNNGTTDKNSASWNVFSNEGLNENTLLENENINNKKYAQKN